MATFVDSKIITLTSQSATVKRNGNYLSNVYYDMNAFIKDEPDIIHRQVTLQSAQIPYSFYVINYTNNQFKYQLASGTIYTSTIPVGNYTGNSLITALKTALTANSITLAITLSSINGQLTFTHATQNFTFYALKYSILPTLGFASGTDYTSASFTITTPFPLNLLGIKVLQVRSTVFNTLNYSSVSGGITTLLATIPVSATPFGMIDFTDKGQTRITFSNSEIDSIDVEILDGETGEFINFNNQDWTMTFCIYLTKVALPPLEPPSTILSNKGALPSVPRSTIPPTPEPTPLEKSQDEKDLELLMR
jgi:hypothetical protein